MFTKNRDYDKTNSLFNLEELHLLLILSYSDCFDTVRRWVFLKMKIKDTLLVLYMQKDPLNMYLNPILPARNLFSFLPSHQIQSLLNAQYEAQGHAIFFFADLCKTGL